MIYKPWNSSSSQNTWSSSPKKREFSGSDFINKVFSPKYVQAKKELQAQIETALEKKHRAALDILLDTQWHDGSLMYSWSKPDDTTGTENWWYKFSQIPESPAYKQLITDNEEVLYKTWRNEISSIISDANIKRIWDIWWSDGHKFTKIMDILDPKIMDKKTVITKDISPYLIDEHTKTLQERSHTKNINIQTTGVLEDFLSDEQIKIQKWEWRAFFVFGGSICNLSSDVEVIRFLQTLSSDKVRGSRDIFMTIHTAPDKEQLSPETYQQEVEKILCAYGGYLPENPHFSQATYDAIKDWISSGIAHYIGEKNMQFVEFETYWEDLWETWWVVKVWVRVKESFSITTPTGTVTKQAWDFIEGISSKRYSRKSWHDIVQRAWYSQENFISSGYEGLAHLKTPEYNPSNKTPELKNLQNTIKTSLVTALLVWAGIWGWMKRDTKEQKIQKEKDWIEAINKYWDQYGRQAMQWYGMDFIDGNSLITSWEYGYQEIFLTQYNLSEDDTEKIKYDFLGWLVEQKKNGNYNTYGQYDTNGTNYDDIVSNYILEAQTRIKHSLNITLEDRYQSLKKYEWVFANMINKENHLVSFNIPETTLTNIENKKDSIVYKWDTYSNYIPLGLYTASSDLIHAHIAVVTKNGAQIVIAKHRNNNDFSSDLGLRVAKNYFTIPWQDKLFNAISRYIDRNYNTWNNSRDITQSIIERFQQLRIEWYIFHTDKFLSSYEYDYKLTYFLETFCGDIIVTKYHTDKNYISFNMWSKIDTIINNIPAQLQLLWLSNTTIPQRTKNILKARIFEVLMSDSSYGLGSKPLSPKKCRHILITYSDILFTDTDVDFPFTRNRLVQEWWNTDRNLTWIDPKAWYASIELAYWQWSHISTGRWVYLAAPKTPGIKTTLPWRWDIYWDYHNNIKKKLYASLTPWDKEASMSPYFNKLTQHYLKNEIIEKHGPWRSFEEQKIIMKWPHGNNKEAYDEIVEKRKELISEVKEFLKKPNTYVAKLFYDEWRK